jgi:hypothetical protein
VNLSFRELKGVMIGWWNDAEESMSPFDKKRAMDRDLHAIRENWR